MNLVHTLTPSYCSHMFRSLWIDSRHLLNLIHMLLNDVPKGEEGAGTGMENDPWVP